MQAITNVRQFVSARPLTATAIAIALALVAFEVPGFLYSQGLIGLGLMANARLIVLGFLVALFLIFIWGAGNRAGRALRNAGN